MSVDLSQYLDQEVRVTYENGDKIIGKVKYYPVNKYNKLNYSVRNKDNFGGTYTRDGFYWTDQGPHPLNIVKIEPITMKKYEQLEKQIRELQAEVERLKKKEEEGEKLKLPKDFSREKAIAFLEEPKEFRLCQAFDWESTAQGDDYWSKIGSSLYENPSHSVPEEAIIAIQSWIIQSYKEQYEV